jgi:hypothetical protein
VQLSGSSIARGIACPGSAVLPRPPRTTSPAAERGIAIHAYLAEALDLHAPALALMRVAPQWRHTCAAIDLDEITEGHPVAGIEIAFAYNVATGTARTLGEDLGRAYDLTPDEIAGTADLLLDVGDGVYRVIDYKTGQRVEPAHSNAQLAFLALCVSRVYGASDVGVELIYIADDGGLTHDRGSLDAGDLAAFADRLRDAVARIRAAAASPEPETHTGDHCRYCPAFTNCPAQLRLAQAYAGGAIALSSVGGLTPQAAGAALAKLRDARRVLDAVEDQLKTLSRSVPLVLPDGQQTRVEDFTTTTLDGDIAYGVLERLHGTAKARELAPPSVSRVSLKRGLGTLLARQAVDAIERAGGVRSKTYERWAVERE